MILCVCARGNVRSVTLAAILKDGWNEKDVIAVGLDTSTHQFLNSMVKQASKIYVVGEQTLYNDFCMFTSGADLALSEWAAKLEHVDVGADVWQQPMHPELVKALVGWMLDHGGYNTQSPTFGSILKYIDASNSAYKYSH